MVPGVVVAVPLPQRRVPAVGRVMAAQSVSGVVGHRVQVIHSALCRERQTGVSHQSPAESGERSPPATVCFLSLG